MTQAKTLCTAVIGTGYLGRFHAQKYRDLPDAALRAVVDADPKQAAAVAAECGCEAFTELGPLLALAERGELDAVSIATPTRTHHAIARQMLAAGVHVLVEKPITVTRDEAEDLLALAEEKGCVLQVGHLERFNPALLEVESRIQKPLFIEAHRLSPFKVRGSDVNVVLDLMIHDIDIIQHLVKSEIRDVRANGAAVVSDDADIANVRLDFENGCVANVTASRVSDKVERRMRIFQKDNYIAIDFQNNAVKICDVLRHGAMPEVHCVDHTLAGGDAIRAEIVALLNAIRTGQRPLVSGEDGLRAVSTAIDIGSRIVAGLRTQPR